MAAYQRKLGKTPSADARNKLEEKRARLRNALESFEGNALRYLSRLEDGGIVIDEVVAAGAVAIDDLGVQYDGAGEDEDDDGLAGTVSSVLEQDGSAPPERTRILLPSLLGRRKCRELGAQAFVSLELQLRQGQANDALHAIRVALGHKAYLFRNNVRHANSQQKKLRAWGEVIQIETSVQHQARVYAIAQKAIHTLTNDTSILERYQVLERDHLKITTVVVDPSQTGQRNTSLPWFWTMDAARTAADNGWMGECEFCMLSYG